MSAWQIRTARSPRSASTSRRPTRPSLLPVAHAAEAAGQRRRLCGVVPANLFGASETSRLWNRVRETEGLSYNVRALSVSAFEPNASWSIYAIYAPQNRERLEKAVGEELARVLKDGFSDKEISDGITALLNYRNLARARMTWWPACGWTTWNADAPSPGRPTWTRRSRADARRGERGHAQVSAPGRLQHRRRRRLQESGALTHNRAASPAPPLPIQPLPRQLLARRHDAPPCLPARSCACRHPTQVPRPSRISHGRLRPEGWYFPFHLWGNS